MKIKSPSVSFGALIICFIVLFVLFPLSQQSDIIDISLKLCLSCVIVFSVYAVADNKKHFYILIFLAIPWLITEWVDSLDKSLAAQVIFLATAILFYWHIAHVFFRYIFKTKAINMNIIYCSICVYFLFGLVFGMAYTLVDLLIPGSFKGIPAPPVDFNYAQIVSYKMSYLVYFSYITLTTLGYGHIAPISHAASSLASIEAILGQLYIAILIAHLVGMRIARSRGN